MMNKLILRALTCVLLACALASCSTTKKTTIVKTTPVKAPPGQVKKVTGSQSAKQYAPGQQKKKKK